MPAQSRNGRLARIIIDHNDRRLVNADHIPTFRALEHATPLFRDRSHGTLAGALPPRPVIRRTVFWSCAGIREKQRSAPLLLPSHWSASGCRRMSGERVLRACLGTGPVRRAPSDAPSTGPLSAARTDVATSAHSDHHPIANQRERNRPLACWAATHVDRRGKHPPHCLNRKLSSETRPGMGERPPCAPTEMLCGGRVAAGCVPGAWWQSNEQVRRDARRRPRAALGAERATAARRTRRPLNGLSGMVADGEAPPISSKRRSTARLTHWLIRARSSRLGAETTGGRMRRSGRAWRCQGSEV